MRFYKANDHTAFCHLLRLDFVRGEPAFDPGHAV